MRLTDEGRAMLAGADGAARGRTIEDRARNGRCLGAADVAPVSHAQIPAARASLGPAEVGWLQRRAIRPRAHHWDSTPAIAVSPRTVGIRSVPRGMSAPPVLAQPHPGHNA